MRWLVSRIRDRPDDVIKFTATPATEESFRLGEGPVWDGPRERLLWVDIAAGSVYEGRLTVWGVVTTARHDFDGTVGAVVCAEDGRLLVAATTELVLLSGDRLGTVGPTLIGAGRNSRLNDGGCDPAGRFLVGSLGLDQRAGSEGLYRLEMDGTVTCLDDDLYLSNGLAWSPDGTTFYSIDTTPGIVWARSYDPTTGLIGHREQLLHIADGWPDGLCIDADGNLWIAIYGAGEVRCFSPHGELLATVTVAAPKTTSAAFVGRDLDTLLITTATEEMTEQERTMFPHSGRPFTAKVKARGLPTTPWRPLGE